MIGTYCIKWSNHRRYRLPLLNSDFPPPTVVFEDHVFTSIKIKLWTWSIVCTLYTYYVALSCTHGEHNRSIDDDNRSNAKPRRSRSGIRAPLPVAYHRYSVKTLLNHPPSWRRVAPRFLFLFWSRIHFSVSLSLGPRRADAKFILNFAF